eukprot:GFUD01012887.1.p1 GENE.GFUD01012887.1~~GFUD01012887.1.p1  ORF type:complete len:273 (-),score=76.54 GFUD01012887.1:201-1019(-)
MEGCLSSLVKYLLFTTNFLIFILGITVFGLGIWVVVDKPSFLTLFETAQNVGGDIGTSFDVEIYTSAAYILMVVSCLVVIISFFGCCGAIKENKCMLGTYFTLILAMFIVMVVGAVLGYSGDLEKTIKTPLSKALLKYQDDPTESGDPALWAYKQAWNEVQTELKCCGVDNVKDWENQDGDFKFPTGMNKPDGCCNINQAGDGIKNGTVHDVCRGISAGDQTSSTYYFEGCYTKIKSTIEDNQNMVVGVAIGVVVVMFLNMLFSFAMCTMVK